MSHEPPFAVAEFTVKFVVEIAWAGWAATIARPDKRALVVSRPGLNLSIDNSPRVPIHAWGEVCGERLSAGRP